ncbi:ABC transporter permease [Chitinophaga sp. Cy-1792]|uniref:ABC transporter permease n=1 Tax=Chitinophaga sp. Cy-1792 TaxID=2608339 RepID=UPI0014223688|nr:ABC transporter permease [Chitinophaga sp. Cy-1792]NIG54970.1 FtsX-like permease family protein [Chitinophaga sp. Cy-1792]
MISNYLRIVWRNMQRNRMYTVINITGLAMGVTCAILIFCLINYHYSFDNYHPDKERIYRVVSETSFDNQLDPGPAAPTPMAGILKSEFAFTDAAAMRSGRSAMLVTTSKAGDASKFKFPGAYIQPDYFKIFDIPMLNGSRPVLTEPNTALVTRKVAEQLYPGKDPVGKPLVVNNNVVYTIAGILADVPVNTDNQEQIYLPFENLRKLSPGFISDSNWNTLSTSMQCYLKVKPGVKAGEVDDQLKGLVNKYYSKEDAKLFHYFLQPLSERHFDSRFNGVMDKRYLRGLALIGMLLIVTACINFVNLATAQSIRRSKEVGVRKALGGTQWQMLWQFLFETSGIVAMALAVGCVGAILSVPYLNSLFNVKINININLALTLAGFALGLFVVTSLLAGFYPGWLLSRFKPVEALKGKVVAPGGRSFNIRRGLVVVQFVLVQFMIISTVVIARQMYYAINADLGFKKDNILLMDLRGAEESRNQTLKNQLMQVPGVTDVALCYSAPLSDNNNYSDVKYDNNPVSEAWQVNTKNGDEHYLGMFGIKLVAGRNFYANDTNSVMVNEMFVKKLRLKSPEAILGKRIKMNGRFTEVVGVVKDFNNLSLHHEIDPIGISYQPDNFSNGAIKMQPGNLHALDDIKKVYAAVYPEQLVDYVFLDDDIAQMYEVESVMMKLIRIFAAIAILIGCIGLLGLVSFLAVQKRKEIGVRRVLGATVGSILWLFGREFARLILIAFIVAAPLAALAMSKWLQGYAYSIHLGFRDFLLPAGITAVIVLITVWYTSYSAASMNPVKSIRTE